MMDRIMVKVTCIADWIKFRTIRRGYEALDGIAVSRGVFEDLEAHGYAAQNGSNSFAVFRRDCFRGTVSIRLAWLNYCGRRLFGWEECVILDYEKLMAFVRDSAVPNGPKDPWYPARPGPGWSFAAMNGFGNAWTINSSGTSW